MTYTINVMFASGPMRGRLIAVEARWWNDQVCWGPAHPTLEYCYVPSLSAEDTGPFGPDHPAPEKFEVDRHLLKAWPVFCGRSIHPRRPWIFAPHDWSNERLNEEIQQLEMEGKL